MGPTILMSDYTPQRRDESFRTPSKHRRWRLYNVVSVPILKKAKATCFYSASSSSIRLHSRTGIEENPKTPRRSHPYKSFVFFLFFF